MDVFRVGSSDHHLSVFRSFCLSESARYAPNSLYTLLTLYPRSALSLFAQLHLVISTAVNTRYRHLYDLVVTGLVL